MEYLIAILINSLYIVGLYQSFQEGMIFEKLNPYKRYKLWLPERKFWNTFFKPIIGCVVCMSSVHGLLFLTVFKNYIHLDVSIVVFYIFALCGINRIVSVIADL